MRSIATRWLWIAAALLFSACPSLSDVKAKPTDAQVHSLLHQLFPSLSDAAVARFSAMLDIEAALALKLEIDDIRRVAESLSKELGDLANKAAATRQSKVADRNGGLPETLEPIGRTAYYRKDQAAGRIELCGVYRNHDAVSLSEASVSVMVDGMAAPNVTLDCVPKSPVDVVFVVDITGSMSPVIGAVRRSLAAFVDAIVQKHVQGTLSIVTFQDSVGVNVDFQERKPASGYERSPFFAPVAIDDASGISDLADFIARLEANSGADVPENLAGALDFARNNVIGTTHDGKPNVIGDGVEDPRDTAAWPGFDNAKQIFVVFTDAPFHADSRTPQNSSLLAPFKPRPIADILKTLQMSATTVHVSDPSWVDHTLTPTGASGEVDVDADYWAVHTGGLGDDATAGYSLIDLDVVVVAKQTALLDILLDGVIGTACSVNFAVPTLSATASFDLDIELAGDSYRTSLQPVRL